MQLLDTASTPASCRQGRREGEAAGQQVAAALPQARERFIPVSRHGLRAKLVAMLAESGGDPKAWGRALDCLAAWRHQEHRQRLLDLIEDYLPFSPDSDTANLIELDAVRPRQGAGRVHRRHREDAGASEFRAARAGTTCSGCWSSNRPTGSISRSISPSSTRRCSIIAARARSCARSAIPGGSICARTGWRCQSSSACSCCSS